MIALLVIVLLVVLDLAVGVRLVRQDRSRRPPASHQDWSTGSLPSRPYAER